MYMRKPFEIFLMNIHNSWPAFNKKHFEERKEVLTIKSDTYGKHSHLIVFHFHRKKNNVLKAQPSATIFS